MPVSVAELQQASYRYSERRTLTEARAAQLQTAFLCHSHKDEDLAKGLQVRLRENGWDVYIDWQDTAMPPTPDRRTAERIQGKIKTCDWLLYLATPNSSTSRWCPWEIGYADGVKGRLRILIVTTQSSGETYGAEYLQLYRQVSESTTGGWHMYEAGVTQGGKELRSMHP